MWMLPFADSHSQPDHVEVLDEAYEEEEVGVGDEISKTLMVLLPWSISVLFHLAIILLAFFLGWVVVQQQAEEEIVIASPTLNEPPPIPIQAKLEARKPDEKARKTPQPPAKPKVQVVSEVPLDSVLAVVSPTATMNPLQGEPGNDNFFGAGSGDGGGGGIQPTQIAFVIDASGSLIDTFPFVVEDLKRFIRNLERKQSFTIIFYGDDKITEVPPGGLRKADSQHKQKVIDWIDMSNYNVVPKGSGDPVKALQRALSYKPQLIYLLSDNITGRGRYSINQQDLLNEIKRSNRSNTKISTIQFLYEDPLALAPDETGKVAGPKGRTLAKIADMTGGVHQFVPASELNIH